jgi:shikimate dehydrogenase
MTMEISGATRLAAVIGSPVGHSLSPVMHNAAFAASGVDWRLVAFDVAAGRAGDAVAAMATLGIGGFAVTMPHKEQMAAVVDEVDPAAAALRSVNTVLLRDDGTTFGASTDGAGFVDSLLDAGYDPRRRRVVVLGAGGAARSIVDALGRAGADDIAVVNRTRERAEGAASLAAAARVGTLDDIEGAEILVNSTSIGMGTDAAPVERSLLRSDLVVADNVYHPLETALLRAAREAGAETVDGLGMLVHQAVRQQELWTGVVPEPGVLRRAAEAELRARAS